MIVRSEIPRAIDDFNPFIINTTDYLLAGVPTNAERLGILLTEIEKWSGFAIEWIPLYMSYTDEKVGRTRLVKDQLLSVIERFVVMNQTYHLLERIAASPGSMMKDMVIFNIRKKYSRKTTLIVSITPIPEKVTAALQPLVDGFVAVKCYNSKSRAALEKDADSVQYVYRMGDPPTSADDPGLMIERISKSFFSLRLGAGGTAKQLYIYFRWYNAQHPDRSGPWSELYSTLIL